MKKVSLIIFTAIYITSFFTGNFPYPENASHPLLSLLVSLLTVVSFLFVTAAFAYSKKFLITISTYFSCVFIITTVSYILGGVDISWPTLPLVLLVFSFVLPIIHLVSPIEGLLEGLSNRVPDAYNFYILYFSVVSLVYLVYFLCRRRQQNR